MDCRSFNRVAAFFACCFLSGIAFAGESAKDVAPTTTETASSESNFSLSGEFDAEETYIAGADVVRGNRVIGDFDEGDTILRFVLTPRIKFGVLRLGAEWERFSFGFPDRTPLPNTLQSANLIVGLDTQFSDSFLIRIEAQPGIYGTNDLSTNDFNVPFVLGGTYIYSPNLQFVLGVGLDADRKYPVLPGGGVRWKIAPQWVLNAVLPTPRLEFELAKNVTLYGGATLKETNFRVASDFGSMHGNPRLNNAVITYSEVRTGIGFDWKLSSAITLSGEVGYQPYRTFDFYRADVRFREESGAPYGMISLHGAF
jgi:hypothetical protein